MMRSYPSVLGTFAVVTGNTLEEQMEYDMLDHLTPESLSKLDQDGTYYLIYHEGYVDYDLFENSSMILMQYSIMN